MLCDVPVGARTAQRGASTAGRGEGAATRSRGVHARDLRLHAGIVSRVFLGVTLHWRAVVGVVLVVGSTIWFNSAADLSRSHGSSVERLSIGIDMEGGENRKVSYSEISIDDDEEEGAPGASSSMMRSSPRSRNSNASSCGEQ